MDREQTLKLLRLEEGLSREAYLCSEGFWTIGYGHNLEAFGVSKGEAQGMVWTKEQAEQALIDEFEDVLAKIRARWTWFDGLTDARKAVLASMGFQMGIEGLAGFKKTLKLLQQGDYAGAAVEMLRSRWNEQTSKRAKRHSGMMRDDVWLFNV